MAAPKRTKVQREHDLSKIAELYLKGHTQAAIGETLGLTQQIVSRDLSTIQKRWEEKSTIDLDTARRRNRDGADDARAVWIWR